MLWLLASGRTNIRMRTRLLAAGVIAAVTTVAALGHIGVARRAWTPGYDFGSLDAVQLRWRAAINSRVDLIATNHYAELAAQMRAAAPSAAQRLQ